MPSLLDNTERREEVKASLEAIGWLCSRALDSDLSLGMDLLHWTTVYTRFMVGVGVVTEDEMGTLLRELAEQALANAQGEQILTGADLINM